MVEMVIDWKNKIATRQEPGNRELKLSSRIWQGTEEEPKVV